jgi:hypothetical protein
MGMHHFGKVGIVGNKLEGNLIILTFDVNIKFIQTFPFVPKGLAKIIDHGEASYL